MGRKALLTVLLLSASSLIFLRSATERSAYRLTVSAPRGFDRARAQSDTERYLVRLIGLDTQNPPGNELRVAKYSGLALQLNIGGENQK